MKNLHRSSFFFTFLCLLLAQLIVLPVQAARKTTALVPVVSSDFSGDDASVLYENLAAALTEQQKFHLTDTQALVDYFAAEEQGSDVVSEGDTLYLTAKQSYLQFDNKNAEKNLDKAIAVYQNAPGNQGGLYQAYLLKALMEHESGQTSKAKKNVEGAIAVHLDAAELTDNFYSPRFRQMYKTVRDEYIKNHPTVTVDVQVAGQNENSFVYANGVEVGRGPQVKLTALADQPLFLQAGLAGKLYRVKPKADGENKIRIRGKIAKVNTKQSIGFAASTPNLVPESQWLGQKVGAAQVILLTAAKSKGLYDVSLSVVDSETGKLTEPKHFEVAHLKQDAASASSVMAQYLASLGKKDFQANPDDGIPILIGQKKTSGWVYAALGSVVLAGAGAAVYLATSGSSSPNPDAGVKVDIPPFEEDE